MYVPATAVCLIGSPRRKTTSTSYSLALYLRERMKQTGLEVKFLHVSRTLRRVDGLSVIIEAVKESDLIMASFPLYVDSLPAPLIRAFEAIARERQQQPGEKARYFMAIVNCGFPESTQTSTALAICRRFAEEAGMHWLGGLGLGGGEAIAGRPLHQAGLLARNVRRALDIAAQAIANGEPIPEKAGQLMGKPLLPAAVYRWLGELRWKREAKRHGVSERLGDRPFLEE